MKTYYRFAIEPIVKRPKSRSLVERERLRIVEVVLNHARNMSYCEETVRALVVAFGTWTPWVFEKPEVQQAWETELNNKLNDKHYDEADLFYTYSEAFVRLFRCSGGYDCEGFDIDGYNAEGYDVQGYNKNGRDSSGYDRLGYDKDGFNYAGFNREGKDRDGNDRSSRAGRFAW